VHAGDSGLVCSRDRSGALVARVGAPLTDVYLEVLGGRCRPNTVRAAAYDLKVFFAAAAKPPPDQVRPADVLAFITAQRTGRAGERCALQPLKAGAEPGGVSAATVRWRLSIVSGFFAFLRARGDMTANPVPRATHPAGAVPSRPGRPAGARRPDLAADLVPGRGRCADGGAAHPPGPGHGRGDGAGRAALL
jgi:integrase/recombinase XerD